MLAVLPTAPGTESMVTSVLDNAEEHYFGASNWNSLTGAADACRGFVYIIVWLYMCMSPEETRLSDGW